MPFFASPSSFRLLDDSSRLSSSAASFSGLRQLIVSAPMDAVPLASRASHPALGNLILLVFEAVLEVVCVSLPGYIVARQGMFDVESQKFVANLNVALFTPCLSMRRSRCGSRVGDGANRLHSLYQTGFSTDGLEAG